jgi:hypothetical protein
MALTLSESVSVQPALKYPCAKRSKYRTAVGELPYFPIPLSAILCGDPVALSVMVIEAVTAPVADGEKCPWMVQVRLAARLVQPMFENWNEDAPVPVTAMLVNFTVVVPVLVTVTVCEALLVPTVCGPNDKVFAESEIVAGPPPPVPLSAMLCGDPLAESVMAMVAVSGPVVVGEKCP